MTLLNSKRIIKHYLQIPTFAIFEKLRFHKKNLKMVKNPQNLSKKLFLSLKYLILMTFKVKNQKKIGHVFLGLFTWNHPKVTNKKKYKRKIWKWFWNITKMHSHSFSTSSCFVVSLVPMWSDCFQSHDLLYQRLLIDKYIKLEKEKNITFY